MPTKKKAPRTTAKNTSSDQSNGNADTGGEKRLLGAKQKIENYRRSAPAQLKLFELLHPTESNYSNTIELYDFMPKYVWGRVERIQEKFLEPVERDFECRGVRYRVRIVPARVKDSDGISRDYLPGKREELIEDALRKIATEGQGIFLDDEAGVTFTLYQLQQELKRTGHSYSITQLKESLMICVGTLLHLTDENEQAIFASSLFNTIGLQTREDWEGQGEKSKAFVRFNALVTTSIRNRTFRQFNYETSMGYQNIISRQLHKRLSHHYTQASLSQPYSILLTTVIRDFGLKNYEKISHNLRDVETALKEMVQECVLLNYEQSKIMDTKKRNKIVDVRLTLRPHPKFINEVIRANNKQKDLRQADLNYLPD